jgi:hypothetical protein
METDFALNGLKIIKTVGDEIEVCGLRGGVKD